MADKKLMHYISSNPLALVLYRKDCFVYFSFVFKLLCLEFILVPQVNPVNSYLTILVVSELAGLC